MYCPICGRPSYRQETETKYSCSRCGYVFFQNVAAAVAVFIRHDDEILFTVRGREPARGMLDLPGGFVDPGEGLEEAAARELMEELGLAAGELRYLFSLPNEYPYRNVLYYTTDAFFEVKIRERPDFVLSDEIESWCWASPVLVSSDEIGFRSVRYGVERYCRAFPA